MSKKKITTAPKIELLKPQNTIGSERNSFYFWLFFGLAFILYLPTLNFGFVLDDVAVIEQNKFVQKGVEGISDILSTFYWKGYWDLNSGLYRPLSLIMFAIEWTISPNNPFIHHLVSLLLFSVSIGLLYNLLRRLITSRSHWIPFWITALFMLHPSHTEVIANIKSRDEILAFLFLLLLLLQLLNFVKNERKQHIGLGLVFYFLALLSKEGAITFLPILLVFFLFTYKKSWLQSIKLSLPFFIVTLLWLGLRFWVISNDGNAPINYTYLDNSLVACSNGSQLATGIGLFGKYFLESLFPVQFSYDYSFNEVPCLSLFSFPVIFGILVFLSLIFIILKTRRSTPILAFGAVVFLSTIALVTNVFFLIGTTYANRLVYIPSLGILILLVVGIYELASKYRPNLLKNLHCTFIPFGIYFLTLTIQRIPAWESNTKLFETDSVHAENSARIHFNYGTSLMKQSEKFSSTNPKYLLQATKEFEKAILIDSLDFGSYVNLGVCQYRLEAYEESVNATKKAIAINPKDTILYGNLGDAYFSLKNYKNAIQAYDVINQSTKLNDTFLNKEGTSHFQLGNFKEAISTFEKGYELAPSNAELQMNLANAYGAAGTYPKAAQLLEVIYNKDPSNANALRLLKITLNQLGDVEKLKALEKK